MTDSTTERREWTVSGMDCAACTVKVTRAVERLPGVSDVKVALMGERLSLALADGATAAEEIEKIVRRLGYGIAPREREQPRQAALAPRRPHDDGCGGTCGHDRKAASPSGAGHGTPAGGSTPWYRTAKGRLVILTGALLSLAWAFELLAPAEWGYRAFLLACLIGVAPVAKRAFEALRLGQPFTIESLMTIAATGALFIGAAEEAALVVFLFAVGEVLEGVAAGKARDGIRALANLVPRTAIVEIDGQARETPADSLQIGQVVLVRPGDRVPADGEILDGTSGIDESPVTGESVPRTRGPGEPVFAGSINAEAALRVRVTREASDNTIARIIRLVEEAEEARAPTERFIDRFSRWYMPAIVGLAALVVVVPPLAFGAEWGTWIYRGLALLLIGCPCALVISVPASIASSLSAGARRGMLMKGGAVIEAAARVSHVAFDKTGTLTHGKPVVTDLIPAPGIGEAALLEVAGGVEAGSSHPLAQAILSRLAQEGVTPLPARAARVLVGQGAEAVVGGAPAWVSLPRHAAQRDGIEADALREATRLEGEGKTVVAVFRDGQPLGLIAMRDEPRGDAAEAMRQLRDLNVGAIMLTGDNPRTAAAIAGGLGMDYRAEMMPEDKLAAIRETGLPGSVMMIGDGINDAPALKQAGIGVAMGSGTDVALETADAAILRDRVTDVPALIRLARATMGNIRQNVTIALGLKAVFLVTSVLGITGLWIAILADTGATVLVTLNALRLLRFRPEQA
ncbi:heavy metal translocating P-type ATPase [Paracoccus denitrificans]|jgi:Cd2+/Zn2+-exporting ATPase|nr:heavy metal translocating P-type ATPase [Paracoccus denitrificans]MBB4627842.1 Cd2+/Zn2+-exporting ATPase [Paracoccus denitrificans]MCU7428623.1 heavy metal translocating P-type ATPase [Paracoccus denitrificans]QAR26413.1 heavy metal translocating P-type ATPase [Paracoccus denitrificans]UPV95345.1 heavy metal translocating P-type ATPase [Paracoccus denitrificans]WQO32596.1 heavy metal translocating P-type ATPase [Paracoccus denitrificans]